MTFKKNTHGENLKAIRKYLHLKQTDLAGLDITRNLISLMENNKSPINPKTAQLISTNINNILKNRFSNAIITTDDIMIPGIFFAKLEANKLLHELEDYGQDFNFNTNGYLHKMNAFYALWDLPEMKFKNYYLLGEHFEKYNQIDKSYMYFARAYENAIRLEDKNFLGEVAVRLTSVALLKNSFESAILLSDVLKNYTDEIKYTHMVQTIINEASAFYFLENYEQAIDALLNAEHLLEESSETSYIEIQIMKADLYMKKGMFGIAGRILNSLSNKINQFSIEAQIYIFSSLMQLNIKQNNIEVAKKYYFKITSSIETIELNESFAPEIYSKIADASLAITSFDDYIRYITVTFRTYSKTNNRIKFTFHINQAVKYFENSSIEELGLFEKMISEYYNKDILKDNHLSKLKLIRLYQQHKAYNFIAALLK